MRAIKRSTYAQREVEELNERGTEGINPERLAWDERMTTTRICVRCGKFVKTNSKAKHFRCPKCSGTPKREKKMATAQKKEATPRKAPAKKAAEPEASGRMKKTDFHKDPKLVARYDKATDEGKAKILADLWEQYGTFSVMRTLLGHPQGWVQREFRRLTGEIPVAAAGRPREADSKLHGTATPKKVAPKATPAKKSPATAATPRNAKGQIQSKKATPAAKSVRKAPAAKAS